MRNALNSIREACRQYRQAKAKSRVYRAMRYLASLEARVLLELNAEDRKQLATGEK